MGAGASAETARTTVTTMLSGKPADASDITVILGKFSQQHDLANNKRILLIGSRASES